MKDKALSIIRDAEQLILRLALLALLVLGLARLIWPEMVELRNIVTKPYEQQLVNAPK